MPTRYTQSSTAHPCSTTPLNLGLCRCAALVACQWLFQLVQQRRNTIDPDQPIRQVTVLAINSSHLWVCSTLHDPLAKSAMTQQTARHPHPHNPDSNCLVTRGRHDKSTNAWGATSSPCPIGNCQPHGMMHEATNRLNCTDTPHTTTMYSSAVLPTATQQTHATSRGDPQTQHGLLIMVSRILSLLALLLPRRCCRSRRSCCCCRPPR
jgi:hypothetical protein